MWATLSSAEKVTLIGIQITFLIGLCNLFVSIHKNRVNFISQNRMMWIREVRELSSAILSWKYTDSTVEILKLINKLIMYLNISNNIDEKISSELLKMFDSAYKLSFYRNLKLQSAKTIFEEYYSHKQEFRTLIRIYLKKEWVRVKVESQVIKLPFVQFWIPFKGFDEKWATKKLMEQYESIKQYEFDPWIDFSPEEQHELNDSELSFNSVEDEHSVDNAAAERRRLREALLREDEQLTIHVPSALLAGGVNESTVPDGKHE